MKIKLLSLILLSPIFVFAAGGIDKVNTFMENLSTALYALGAVLLTIAFMWGGSKIMFQGQTLRESCTYFHWRCYFWISFGNSWLYHYINRTSYGEKSTF